MPPGHDMTRFYSLLPLLAALAALAPTTAEAILTALGICVAYRQLH